MKSKNNLIVLIIFKTPYVVLCNLIPRFKSNSQVFLKIKSLPLLKQNKTTTNDARDVNIMHNYTRIVDYISSSFEGHNLQLPSFVFQEQCTST